MKMTLFGRKHGYSLDFQAFWKEYEIYGEKGYEYRCIDPAYIVGADHHIINQFLWSHYYSTGYMITDPSKKLVYLGDDQFQILSNDEPVEIVYKTNWTD